jgi:hypothetical protein
MKNLFLLGGLLALLLFTGCEKPVEEPMPSTFNHDQWNTLLKKYVNTEGKVDYTNFKDDLPQLDTYIQYLKDNVPTTEWSDNKKMAYWINLYNAFTIQQVLQNYPINSIKDIGNGDIWNTAQIAIGDRSYTLNQIEKENLILQFGEEKVHFAINCAAKSCPPLFNKAWEEDNIQQYYTDRATAFINNSTYNIITNNSVIISAIFDWYTSDFGGTANLIPYLQQYSTTTIDNNATVLFSNYDWDLNDQKTATPPPPANTLSHAKWDSLLQVHVNAAGEVDYASFKNDLSILDNYIIHLQNNAPNSWTANKEMAYWINLYNAFTIQQVLVEYPVNSITDIDNGDIWNVRTVTVGGTAYTLNQIEQNQLLTKFSEPKVHFAVNCAAKSCPPLLNKAWTESNIQQNYTDRTNLFINDATHNQLTASSIQVSKIFDWYASDFGGPSGIVPYFQQYSTTTINNNATVTYNNYDWALNKQ